MAINLKISENIKSTPLSVQSNEGIRYANTDDGNPYYVGARAYVTQTSNGAVITVIDKEGTTTATILNGRDGQAGTTDYLDLTNKPLIEGVTLTGDKSFPELNLDILNNTEIQEIFDNLF